MSVFILICAALILDAVFGEPQFLWRFIPHPVVCFGAFISLLEARLNRPGFTAGRRYFHGFLALFLLLAAALLFGLVLRHLAALCGVFSLCAEALFLACFLAQKSLADHVGTVYRALTANGSAAENLAAGRRAVAQIVGRDTEQLDASGVCRAAIESLAENSSDGVIAPLFWFLLLGLPGLCAYKMLNTADSMIGHENHRYQEFGFAAAKADDIANFFPARLTALLAVAAAFFLSGCKASRRAFTAARRDARFHCSPNAGWPEAAFAGALNIRLAGPRCYGSRRVEEKFQNAAGSAAAPPSICAALRLFWLMMLLLGLFSAAAALLIGLLF